MAGGGAIRESRRQWERIRVWDSRRRTPGNSTLFTTDAQWLADSLISPRSPCVVSRYFGGVKGPPRDVQHVVLIFSRVSTKTMAIDPETRR